MEAADPSYGTSYFLQAMATLGIWVGLARWGGLVNEAQQYEVILIWMFAVRPLSTLIHELGHAAAVRYLAHRPADVVVGATSTALRGRLGQVSISFSVVPVLGSQVGGICRYRPDNVGWRTRGWISLAGPGATLLELLVLLALMPVWSGASVIVRDIFAVGGAMLVVNLVMNLIPTPLVRDQQGRVVLGRDGYNARAAFLNARAGAPALGVAAASASMPDVEPTPGRMGVSEMSEALAPVPDPAPASARTLADIWSAPPVVDQEPSAPIPKAAGEGLARGDFAQRALAEIWRGQERAEPSSRGVQPKTPAAPSPEELRGVHDDLRLARGYMDSGRRADAIPLLETAVAVMQAEVARCDCAGERSESYAEEAQRLANARSALAKAYLRTRRPLLAAGTYELLLDDTSGAITAGERPGYRIELAQSLRAAGQAGAAIEQLEALVTELDADQSTEWLIEAQTVLGTTCLVGGRLKEAVGAYEAVLLRIEQQLGADDPKALAVRLGLARAQLQAGETELAIGTFRDVLADAERVLGPSDKLTRQVHDELEVVLRNRRR